MGDAARTIEGLGFAIPVAAVHRVIDDLIRHGFVPGRPRIGITAMAVPGGVRVDSVNPHSDAYRKGVQSDDIVTAVNGTPVTMTAQINNITADMKPGDTITLTIRRDRRTFDLEIMLMDGGWLDRQG
jgi:serine protease Do